MDSVTQLFGDKTVEEMKNLESKTRREIELKKEELRQMVGERYRDLIEAADTITEMKSCSGNVKDSIKDLKGFCSASSLKHKGNDFNKNVKMPSTKNLKRYMEIAAEAKILMELPERIWSEVESGNMMSASFLYLQSLQVLKNLHLTATTSFSPILLWFPMMGQQAQAVANLGSAILKQCRARLNDYLMDPAKTAEALCGIVLLEKKSASEIFESLLESRMSLISDIVDTATDKYQTTGAKTRICECTKILVQTVVHIAKLFCDNSGGLVAELLKECSEQSSQDIINKFMGKHEATKLWSKHLPSETTRKLVDFSDITTAVEQQALQKASYNWLEKVKGIIVEGIKKLLTFVKSAKDLASIKASILEILDIEDDKAAGEGLNKQDQWLVLETEETKKSSAWSDACAAVFNHDLDVWKEILNQLFLDKVNHLISNTFTNLLSECKTILTEQDNLSSIHDVCSYVWQEEEDDITPTLAWNHWQNRKTQPLQNQGGLALKALTITSSVQKSCTSINNVVLALLNDLECYSSDIVKSQLEKRKLLFEAAKEENLETEDNKIIQNHLKTNCNSFLRDLFKLISSLKEEINKEEPETLKSKALHLSLVCRNFFEICSAFKQCCHPQQPQSSMTRSQYKELKLSDPEKSLWKEAVKDMSLQCRDIMSHWCDTILNETVQVYRTELLRSVDNGNLLRTITVWDSISVEEESETGTTVTSHIRVPASATSFTQQLLYDLCSEITKLGGFSPGRFVLRNLSQSCLKAVLSTFSELRNSISSADTSLHGQSAGVDMVPSQTWALQSLFDIRYVHALLYQPTLNVSNADKDDDDMDNEDATPSYTYTELVDWLESYVDPFDLDVFSPHITQNIQRHIQRTSVMLGMLAAPDRMTLGASQKFNVAKDSHNVLPLSPDCGRFSYLPVSSRNNRSHNRLTSSRQLPLASALQELTRSVDEDEDKNSQKKSSSLYSKLGALSSSWLSMSSSYSD